jgi:hypothetical protein
MKNVKELKRILKEAALQDACHNELSAFKEYLKKKDYDNCWKTIIGNIDWLSNSIVDIINRHSPIILQAYKEYGEGIKHHYTGTIRKRIQVDEQGKKQGTEIHYYVDGNISMTREMTDDLPHGEIRDYRYKTDENGTYLFNLYRRVNRELKRLDIFYNEDGTEKRREVHQ